MFITDTISFAITSSASHTATSKHVCLTRESRYLFLLNRMIYKGTRDGRKGNRHGRHTVAAAHARTRRVCRQRKGGEAGGRKTRRAARRCSIFREGEEGGVQRCYRDAERRAGCTSGDRQGSSGGVTEAAPRDEQPPASTDRRRQAKSRSAANTVSQSS